MKLMAIPTLMPVEAVLSKLMVAADVGTLQTAEAVQVSKTYGIWWRVLHAVSYSHPRKTRCGRQVR